MTIADMTPLPAPARGFRVCCFLLMLGTPVVLWNVIVQSISFGGAGCPGPFS